MSQPNDGGPAFPVTNERNNLGLSLRDYFAAAALTGIAAPTPEDASPVKWSWNMLARAAYMAADAMLLARAKEPSS